MWDDALTGLTTYDDLGHRWGMRLILVVRSDAPVAVS
jgi:hypothetical protein